MNHFLLHLLAALGTRGIAGRRIAAVRAMPPVATIAFQGERDVRYGVVVLSAPGPFFYFDSEDPLAGTGAEPFKRVKGLEVRSVSVPELERVLRFELAGPRDPLALAVYLFGSAARIRVEGPETVIESLDPAEGGKPLPPRRSFSGASLAIIDPSALRAAGGSTDRFARGVPGVAPELLERFTAPDGSIDAERLLRFRDDLLAGRAPFMLGTRKRAGGVCPLPAEAAASPKAEPMAVEFGPFEDAGEACRAVGASIVTGLRTEIVERFAAPLAKHLAGRTRLLTALEADRESAEGFEILRNEANILAAFQARIPGGSTRVTLPNLYGEGEVTIELDPAAPLPEQIKKRFRRAGKLERSRGALEKRIRTVREEIEALATELSAARKAASLEEAVRPVGRLRQRFGLEPAPRREERVSSKSRELRRIDLDDCWFVLVGRSDRENDEITFRIAGPDDIWFHAQHTPGSHVVLKSRGASGNPPDSILEAAAAVAAHYSKARRSSVVPVIYTRRKYVRKFRGAKAGQVVCEREKTILAEPRLPDSATE
jgi:predicted ribosome quality control (RQC) complex YloA/Tae2 family protein